MASRTPPKRCRAQRSAQHAVGGAAAGVLQLLCAASWLPVVVTFDTEGHDAIGQTCASAMDQTAIKQVKRLLGGQDASDVAGWGHQVDDSYPGMERLHYQPHTEPFCENVATTPVNCPDNICLLAAIKHFYGRILKDEGRTVGKDMVQIDHGKVAKGIRFTDADAVKMLINLIGDLHQPLHVGFASDDMGKKIQVKFRGKEMSLYDFWDKHIGEVIRADESSFWLGGWTHVGRVQNEFNADKAAWKKDGAFAMFDKWAAENAKFACETAYKHPGTGKMLSGPHGESQPIQIDEAAFQEWRSAWLRQILLAGERTAVVLNDILDSPGAKKLSEGTKIHTKADEEDDKQKAIDAKERKEWQAANPSHVNKGSTAEPNALKNFMTNCVIAAIVVPTFLALASYGLNPFDVKAALAYLEAPAAAASSDPSQDSGGSGPKYSPGAGKRSN